MTIRLPRISGREPTCTAAHTAAPAEMPAFTPSRRAHSRAVSMASSSSTGTISSITSRLSTSGTKPGPIPSILCGPGFPPESTGDEAGSTATTCRPGLRSFSRSPQPVIVPPVPTEATSTSILPSVSRQISSAVVRRWISGLAGFENWFGT